MNRLILLGNGFDLAHGLKTSYNDFIKWYFFNCFENAKFNTVYEDVFLKLENDIYYNSNSIPVLDNNTVLVNKLYDQGFNTLLHENPLLNFENYGLLRLPFKVIFKSLLLKNLVQDCSYIKWVDIENTFYKLLNSLSRNGVLNKDEIEKLNNSMAYMIDQLSVYLNGLPESRSISAYNGLFREPFHPEEQVKVGENDIDINQLMVLNFNYTKTAEQYMGPWLKNLNYIHGNIYDKQNPIIFGFGDELDGNYPLLESANNNSLLKYIKSFGYLKTDNYTNLIRFIQAGEFQIYIMGHSCGLSDRTMLHTLLENKNCKSIRIFYYENKDGENNFENLTQEISRHFKDKEVMREKIVKFPHTSPMPQQSV